MCGTSCSLIREYFPDVTLIELRVFGVFMRENIRSVCNNLCVRALCEQRIWLDSDMQEAEDD